MFTGSKAASMSSSSSSMVKAIRPEDRGLENSEISVFLIFPFAETMKTYP